MNETAEWKELIDYVRFFAFLALQTLVDSSYLLIWYLIESFVSHWTDPTGLPPIDQWLHLSLQISMGIVPTIFVVMQIYKDVRIMWIRIQRKIRREIQLDNDQ